MPRAGYIPSYTFTMEVCNDPGDCCFRREDRRCTILIDTWFYDDKCHFRKLSLYGPNQYDLERKKAAGQ